MKRILFASLLLLATNAHAGFITGMVVGSVLTSSGGTKVNAPSTVLVADHDVIICQKTLRAQLCGNVYDSKTDRFVDVTPALFAGMQGYKTLHKVGAVITERNDYIIMEVSK
jgi:hypothetical protein